MNTNNPLANKVALITGGARRIGACITSTLHVEGMRILLQCRNSLDEAHELQQVLNKSRAHSVHVTQGDLRETKTWAGLVDKTITKFGRLDVIVNNASAFYPTPVGETSENQWNVLMETNLKAPFFLAQAGATALRKNKGCIVNITDIYAQRPIAEHAVYCASKAGLVSLTHSLARELAPDVRVNAVAPGAILWPKDSSDDTAQQTIIDRTPLSRLGTPEDIARAVLYLIRDARFSTGQVLTIDGGRSIVP